MVPVHKSETNGLPDCFSRRDPKSRGHNLLRWKRKVVLSLSLRKGLEPSYSWFGGEVSFLLSLVVVVFVFDGNNDDHFVYR